MTAATRRTTIRYLEFFEHFRKWSGQAHHLEKAWMRDNAEAIRELSRGSRGH